MKLFKLFVLGIFVSTSLLLSSTVFAATAVTNPAVLATVNIVNGQIISQKDNVFKISFSLTNRTGIQSGVKYGVALLGTDTSNQYIADEKVYDESFTLAAGSDLPKEITYEAPKTLSGDYNLYLISRNESGFPFAKVFIKKVTLKASSAGLLILPSSCYLQVVGEKGNPHYSLVEQVDISKDEKLSLTCNVLNSTAKSLTVVPSFETLFRTAYGAIVPATGGSTEAIAIASKEQKTFSVTLPVAKTPQLYDVNMKLSQGNVVSNTVSATYTLSGEGATIVNLSTDKRAYKKGDTATMSLIYDTTGDNSQSRIMTTNTVSNFVAKIAMESNGQECIKPISKSLVKNINSPSIDISATITKDCSSPKITVTLSDNKGNVLDQKIFSINSKANQAESSTTTSTNSNQRNIIILIGALVVVGAALFFISLKKKSNETNPQ